MPTKKCIILAALLIAGVAGLLDRAWGQGVYALHVWSYRQPKEAAQAVENLRLRGLDAYMVQERVAGQGVWRRVLAGRFASPQQAQNLAAQLTQQGVLSIHSMYSIVYTDGVGMTTLGQEPGEGFGAREEVSAFRENVEGSYVASYIDKQIAERQAEGLTLRGWPAYVSEGTVQGKKWYRVYLSPSGEQHTRGVVGGFEILVDLSLTADDGGYQCQNLGKAEVMAALVARINQSAPAHDMVAALRTVGFQGSDPAVGVTRLRYGPTYYDRNAYAAAIGGLAPSASSGPLGWAAAASDLELRNMVGKRILIVISDFIANRDLGEVVERTQALKNKYGPDLCVYTIYVGPDAGGMKTAYEMVRSGDCGGFYDGCLLLQDNGYFNNVMAQIFNCTRCADGDKDGVCDDFDKCPRTPMGAPVDQRGCWIAAFAHYFDSDSAEIKEAYLPNIKQAAQILKMNPTMPVTIAGHTDDTGQYGYNEELGLRRAAAVKQALVQYGVDPVRLKIKSYGEQFPLAPNDTEAGRAQNRRVEFEGWGISPYEPRAADKL